MTRPHSDHQAVVIDADYGWDGSVPDNFREITEDWSS